MDKYRIFISYSHEDANLAMKIVETINNNGLIPMWDKGFLFGHGFQDQIKNLIAHARAQLKLI